MQRDARERLRPMISMMRVPRAMLSFVWWAGEGQDVRLRYKRIGSAHFVFDQEEIVALL